METCNPSVPITLGTATHGGTLFAGHVGAAMLIGCAERRVNVGAFIVAALLLDVLLWLFILLGWESVKIPTNFASSHQPEFVFPYSHSLVASFGWSALVGGAAFVWGQHLGAAKLRFAVLAAAAVFSHWLLDALVHAPELPLAGADTPKVGLWLWQSMPVALTIESVFVVAGIFLFIPGTGLSRAKKVSLTVLALLLLAFTVIGMTLAPAPPSAVAMATSSLATVIVVCALGCWLGRLPIETPT